MKKDLRVSVTKRMMKEALLHLLETKPLDKIKVNELCEVSGVNRATFYRHYETLQDILHEIDMEFIRQIPRTDRPPRNMKEAHSNMEAVCTYIYEHSHMVKLLFLNRTDTDMVQGMIEFYRDFLELKKDEVPMANLDEDTIQIIIALLGGGCQSLLRKWILDDIPKSPGEIATILCNVIRWPGSSDFLMEEID